MTTDAIDRPVLHDITVSRDIRYVRNLDGTTRQPLAYNFGATVTGTRRGWKEPVVTLITCVHVIGLDERRSVYAAEATEAEIAEAFYLGRVYRAANVPAALERLLAYATGKPLRPKWRLTKAETAPITHPPEA